MSDWSGPVANELLVSIDRRDPVPAHEQLERSLREQVRDGRLAAGTALPSTRALASELGLARGVVVEAYGQLAAEGYLVTRQGAPTRVAAVPTAPVAPAARSLLPTFRYHFHPGVPDLSAFPQDRWLHALRAGLRRSPLDVVSYTDPRGLPALRDTLVSYLGRVRGTAGDPERTLVCGGFIQGFALACRTLYARGARRMAIEEPGWMVARLIAQRAGLEPVPVPVDHDGLRVSALHEAGADAVLVTPAHQFGNGTVLSSARRAALIEWAAADRLIVEDDYDAEYRYDRAAVGALQGLAPERVLYIASASKRLSPGLRLGWMLMPSHLTKALVSAKGLDDGGSEVMGQLALREFIVAGELDRHLRRMRLRYRRRRDALVAALGRWIPEARVLGIAAGLYAVVLLPPQTDESAVLAAAARRGVGAEGLSWHRMGDGPPGLLMGYANLSEGAIEQGIRELSEAIVEAASAHRRAA